MTHRLAAVALGYTPLGWAFVHVRGKKPVADNWPAIRPTVAEIATWDVRDNLGVILGSASGGLADVDLDCPEAEELAPRYLPETWVFGRASKPRSHWFYIAAGVRSHQFKDLDGKVMLEIRGDKLDGTPGAQTVIPPSIHDSGEPIEWDADSLDGAEAPLEIEAGDLNRRMAKLARATLLVRHGATVDQAIAEVAAHKPIARPKVQPKQQEKVTTNNAATCRGCGVFTKDNYGWTAPSICSNTCALKLATAYLAAMPASISGSGGHLALFKAAIALVKGFSLDDQTAIDLLERDFNPRCQPTWRARDIAHKVAHAVKAKPPAGYLLDGRRA